MPGQTVQVGRTEWAEIAFPLDGRMSSLHFALENDRGVCRLRDLNSSNGTLVNANRVMETVLANGDRIQAGQTTFVLHIEGGDCPLPSAAAAGPAATSPAACFLAALEDEDPGVRREALLAAVWTRQPWVLDHCRRLGARPSPEHWDAMLLLAVLGKPQDLRTILAIGQAAELGPRRFQVLGVYGHPAAVEMLLAAMGSDDPAAAVAAAGAFTKITGANVDSDRRVPLPPDDGSQSDATPPEPRTDAALPDVKHAAPTGSE